MFPKYQKCKTEKNSKIEFKDMLQQYFERPKLIAVIKSTNMEVVTEKCCSAFLKKAYQQLFWRNAHIQ